MSPLRHRESQGSSNARPLLEMPRTPVYATGRTVIGKRLFVSKYTKHKVEGVINEQNHTVIAFEYGRESINSGERVRKVRQVKGEVRYLEDDVGTLRTNRESIGCIVDQGWIVQKEVIRVPCAAGITLRYVTKRARG